MTFIDTHDLAEYLGVEVTELGWLGEFAIRVASEAVEGVLDHAVGLVEDDEVTLDGTGTDALLLGELPVVEVTAVFVDEVELELSDFSLARGGIIYRTFPSVWTRGRLNIVVTYTHGWAGIGDTDGDQVPMDIREAALDYAREVFQAGSVPPTGIASETLGAYSYTVDTASAAAASASARLGDLRTKLAHYISPRVA